MRIRCRRVRQTALAGRTRAEGEEMSVETNAERAARVARQNTERVEEMVRVPLQEIDKSTWPRHVRPIAISETGGLGIDPDGRLYWNGKPVEIVGSRIDLTWTQTFL